jgi:hypothetical protein
VHRVSDEVAVAVVVDEIAAAAKPFGVVAAAETPQVAAKPSSDEGRIRSTLDSNSAQGSLTVRCLAVALQIAREQLPPFGLPSSDLWLFHLSVDAE